MMRSGLKLLLLTLPLAAVGVGFLAYTVQTKTPPAQVAPGEAAVPIRVITAIETALRPMVTGYGLVAPAETFDAIAEVGGTVAWVNPALERGAFLPAGADLVRIATDDYDLALAQAEANIRAAVAQQAELAVSQDNQRAALAIENDILALRAEELARAETLFAGGSRAQAAVDTARAAWLVQRQKVQSIESVLALIPAQRAGLDETVASARIAGETARLNLARTTLTLPFAARVAQVAVETGRFLRAGEVAAVLDGTARTKVEAQVPAAELRRLLRLSAPDAAAFAVDPAAMTQVLRGLDLTAELRLDLDSDTLTWPGRVDRVSDTIDPRAGTLGVIVVVDATGAQAMPGARLPLTKGMFVEVIIAGRPVIGHAVPRGAVHDGAVHVVGTGSRLQRRPVEIAFIQDRIAMISDGLAEGDEIVVTDIPVPVEGALLAPVADHDLAATLGRPR